MGSLFGLVGSSGSFGVQFPLESIFSHVVDLPAAYNGACDFWLF